MSRQSGDQRRVRIRCLATSGASLGLVALFSEPPEIRPTVLVQIPNDRIGELIDATIYVSQLLRRPGLILLGIQLKPAQGAIETIPFSQSLCQHRIETDGFGRDLEVAAEACQRVLGGRRHQDEWRVLAYADLVQRRGAERSQSPIGIISHPTGHDRRLRAGCPLTRRNGGYRR